MIFNKLFSQYLIDNSIIDAETANDYCQIADELNTPMYVRLADDQVLEEEKIYQVLADYLGYEYRFYQLSEIDLEFVKQYPRDLLIEYQGVPYELKDDELTVLVLKH